MSNSNSITGNSNTQLGFYSNLISNRVTSRVKFVADQTDYDNTSTIAADTDLNSELTGKEVSELKELCTAPRNFLHAERRDIYRQVGGTTTETIEIPLAKVNKTCIVGGFGVITGDCGGTQTFSVGIPGNTDFILGQTVGTDISIPAGATTSIWNQTAPYDTASPDAGSVSPGRIYYAPDRMLAPGTPINLYITAGTSSTIGTGDITFELFATAVGIETYGVTDGNSTGLSKGADRGPIYPLF